MYTLDPKTKAVVPFTGQIGTWSDIYTDMDNRRVALTVVGIYEISTVFLGVAHGFDKENRPIVFETMAFLRGDRRNQEHWFKRYATYKEAVLGHQQAILELSEHSDSFHKFVMKLAYLSLPDCASYIAIRNLQNKE